MKLDKYGTALNDIETFKTIALKLKNYSCFLMAWTDEAGTQLDILFTLDPNFDSENIGLVQGGVRQNDLFVSIMRMGAFGFEVKNDTTHGGYYSEKLSVKGGEMSEKLGELINGVKKELKKL